MRLLVGLALVLLAGVGSVRAEEEKAPWLWMHYLAADNDLELACLKDLVEIVEAQPKGVRVVVLVDRHEAAEPDWQYVNGAVGPVPDFTGTRIFEVADGRLEQVDDWGEMNTADPATLAKFVSTALKELPADRTMLTISDHGSGWPGSCSDEASGHDVLTVPETAAALKQALPAGQKLDIVSFDACVMAMVEVADALAPYARTLVASEELEPGTGYDYGRVFEQFAAAPPADGAALGALLVSTYRATYEQSADADLRDRAKGLTMSSIDLGKMGDVSKAAHALGDALKTALTTGGRTAWLPVARARANAEQYGLSGPMGEGELGLRDLDHFADLVGREFAGTPTAQAAARLRAAVKAAVAHRWNGHARPRASGLGVFLPLDAAAYAAGAPQQYTDLAFGKGGWRAFLEAMVAIEATDTQAARPLQLAASAAVLEGDATITLSSTLASDDLDEVLAFVAVPVDGNVVLVATEPVEPGEDGALSSSWDGGGVALAEGDRRVVVPVASYEEIEGVEDAYAVEVRVAWQRGEAESEVVHLYFEVAMEDEDAGGAFLYAFRDTPSGMSEVDLRAGDVMRPLRLVVAPDGAVVEAVADEPLALADPDALGIDYVRLPAGRYLVGFLARDLAGNLAAEATPVELK